MFFAGKTAETSGAGTYTERVPTADGTASALAKRHCTHARQRHARQRPIPASGIDYAS